MDCIVDSPRLMTWEYMSSLNPGRSAFGSERMPAEAEGLNAADTPSSEARGHSARTRERAGLEGAAGGWARGGREALAPALQVA